MALTVAGHDPVGGAGIGVDLRVFSRLGVHGASVVAALTVQDSERVHRVLAVRRDLVVQAVAGVCADLKPGCAKIGAAGTALGAVVRTLADAGVPVVLDPIRTSSSGAPLAGRGWADEVGGVLPDVLLITPNLLEAEALTGIRALCPAEMEEQARALHAAGARWVLLKGGHLPDDRESPDLLSGSRGERSWSVGPRHGAGPVRGTGCVLSAATAARVARGDSVLEAVVRATEYVKGLLASGVFRVGRGAEFVVRPDTV